MIDLEKRRTRIGGHDAGAIFNAGDYGRDQFKVWHEKKGRYLEPAREPEPPDLRMLMGHIFQNGILDVYTHLTGEPLEHHDRTMVHPARPYMVATPDAFCKNKKRGVDAKLVFWDQHKKWGPNPNEIPPGVIFQCWWYEAFFDIDEWDVIAVVGLEDPRIYTIHRDREVERGMLEYAERWHAKYILGDEIPPMGHSAEAAAYLQRLYPDHARPDLIEADEHQIARLEQYVQVRLEQKRLKGMQAELETEFKAAIKDHEGLEWEAGKFTWRKIKDSEVTAWEALAGDLLGQIEDEEARKAKLAEYTKTKIGYRKIRIDHPALARGANKDEQEQEAALAL